MLYGIEHLLLDLIRTMYDFVGWPGVVALMALETVVFIVPSEAVMTFAGWLLIKEGGLGPEWILLAGLLGGLGTTLGSLPFYYLGLWGGHPVVERYGRYLLLSMDDLDAAERFFDRWGPATVFAGRLVPVVRTFVSIPAGVARMDLRLFVVCTLAGSTLWATALAALGYQLGANWERIRLWMAPVDFIVAAVLGVLIVWYLLHQVTRGWAR